MRHIHTLLVLISLFVLSLGLCDAQKTKPAQKPNPSPAPSPAAVPTISVVSGGVIDSSKNLVIGNQAQVTLQVIHNTSADKVTWSSNATDVLQVPNSAHGIFVVYKPGFAQITATLNGNTSTPSLTLNTWVFPQIIWSFSGGPFTPTLDTPSSAGAKPSWTIDLDEGTPTETLTILAQQGAANSLSAVNFAPGNNNYPPQISIGNPEMVTVVDTNGVPLKPSTNGQPFLIPFTSQGAKVQIKSVKAGVTKISLVVGSQTVVLNINVVEPKVTVASNSLQLHTGDKSALTASVTDSAGHPLKDRNVTWSLADTSQKFVKLDPPTSTDTKTYLEGVSVGGPVSVKATYPSTGASVSVAATVVAANPGSGVATDIVVDDPGQLLVGDTGSIHVQFMDDSGHAIVDQTRRVLQLTVDPQYLVANIDSKDATGRTISIQALQAGQSNLIITFINESTKKKQSLNLAIKILSIAASLKVKLDPMDFSVASDKFGPTFARTYFVVTVAVKNDLKPRITDGQAASVLIYSDSFETYVHLMKRWDNNKPHTTNEPVNKKEPVKKNEPEVWRTVTDSDLTNMVDPYPSEYVDIPLHRVVPLAVASAPSVPQSTNTQPASGANSTPINGSTPVQGNDTVLKFRVPVSQLKFDATKSNTPVFEAHSIQGSVVDSLGHVVNGTITLGSMDSKLSSSDGIMFKPKDFGSFTVKITLKEDYMETEQRKEDAGSDSDKKKTTAINYEGTLYVTAENPKDVRPHNFPYRPYTYDLVTSSFDVLTTRDSRAKTFRIFSLVGTVAGVVTGFNHLAPWMTDAALANNQFTNTLVPSLAKLFPDMTDSQRQYLLSKAMHSSEEVASGDDGSYLLFFPKKAFSGFLPGFETRIEEVESSYFDVQVALVSPRASVSSAPAPGAGTNVTASH